LCPSPVPAAEPPAFQTAVAAEDLDPAAYAVWSEGTETPVVAAAASKGIVWTRTTIPDWTGVAFADGGKPGPRHLRVGFKRAVPVGTVLVRGGGSLSVLKAAAAYPGKLDDPADWIPAERLKGGRVSADEAGREDFAVWVLPPGTSTRALRFTHVAAASDNKYGGWVGGAVVLPARLAEVGTQATAATDSRNEEAARINNGTNDGTWKAWDNGKDGREGAPVSPQRPEHVMLFWPREVPLRGLCALWAGFGAADVQVYAGPADRHPREGAEADWTTVATFDGIENQYPRNLGPNWMDLGRTVATRAVRLRITRVSKEGHPHLKGNTRDGRRIWLGELLALSPLGEAELKTAEAPTEARTNLPHPPIPVRFTLKEPGFVTLVIEDESGRRVRNLVSETRFPAGENVAWWDGMDDLGRDAEAARHGIYRIPPQFVKPAAYRVRGLVRGEIDLRYEFCAYSPGDPPWPTADHTGGWTTNHTPPSATLYVPADKTPNGKPMVYIGSYVSEGGHGLAWVDLDGRKQGGLGHVGGVWTGAPYLARDAGKDAAAGVYVYVAAAWDGDLRLTAIGKAGEKPVAKYRFEGGKTASAVTGLAVRDGVLVCGLPKVAGGQLLFVDAKAGKVLGAAPLEDPRGLAFDAAGRLLMLSGKRLLRTALTDGGRDAKLPAPQAVVADGLEDPQGLALDDAGNILVSDHGRSHQVKVFSPEGRFLRAFGKPGAPAAGPYDPDHMNHPRGITVDSKGRLWVAEDDFQPKRVSVWSPDGKLERAYYGPSEYGGGGSLDPQDKTRFLYHGMEFRFDWDKGTSRLERVLFRPAPGELGLPDGHSVGGYPETPIHLNGKRYLTNCYNCNPTNGTGLAMLWIDRGGLAVPVAAAGRARDWKRLAGDEFRMSWPAGVDPKGEYWKNQAFFVWSDLNGDAQMQPDEVRFLKGRAGGITVMPDLSLVASNLDGKSTRWAPKRFTESGVPVYDLDAGETLAEGVQQPASSGGDQVLVAGDWTVMTVAPKPFAPQSVCGVLKGKPAWQYPDLWPGLHASHEAPTPDRPGELIGTTRLLGGAFTPAGGEAGPLWAINGNLGSVYLFTADGLFVSTLFKDERQGQTWAMPNPTRGMRVNDLTLSGENFWPSICRTADGKVYLVDGARTAIVRVEGLDTIRRLPEGSVTVTADDLVRARDWLLETEALRQAARGKGTLTVALRSAAPTVDGKLDDWSGAEWVDIDKSGTAAWFNSDSKPYNVTAAVAVAGDRLYAAFRTGDKGLLRNSGEMANAPFKTGGALDLMIGSDPAADPKRTKPAIGDARLVVTMVAGKPRAVLYRAVVPGTKEPVPFSSPWRTITLDRVEDVTSQVTLADGGNGDFELSVPLALLGLRPAAGQALRGDVGILRGNGFQTVHRVYWSNKATGITADVPSEAELTPHLWGTWKFAAP
jgi:hypothetical protein